MPNGTTATNPTGTGVSPGRTITQQIEGPTYPTIYIATTIADPVNSVALEFEYLPENVSFGVNAKFEDQPISFTSARWISYDYSEIEEVSLQVKVVAGCNNCITRAAQNTGASNYLSFGGLVTAKYQRNSLIDIAQLLYSLPLPGNNFWAAVDTQALPVPTCRLIVGKMFSGVGAFTGCSIQFNGPYDFDGSPTDMEVSLRFLPSEFYDASTFAKAITGNIGLVPKATPTGESEVTGGFPYALTFAETQIGLAAEVGSNVPGATITPESGSPTPLAAQLGGLPGTIPETKVIGATSQTPTHAEVALAYQNIVGPISPDEVRYDPVNHIYTIGYYDPEHPLSGRQFKQADVIQQVQNWKTSTGQQP